MTIYLFYLLKVSVCLIVFYAFYMLILKNYTFLAINRFYLLSGILLSFTIPLLKISIFESESKTVFFKMVDMTLTESEYGLFQPQNLSHDITSINYSMILPVIYFAGVSVLFFKLLFSIIRLVRIMNRSDIFRVGKLKIVKMEAMSPFSFFNMIFLPKKESNRMIIEHEMAHIRQYHWFDSIIMEIASVLLWFNPFVFLYYRSLKLQHEYLADSSVITNDHSIENYLHCMLRQVQNVSFSGFVSHFYCKTIKKRIEMITKNKTSFKYSGSYLLILPVLALLLFAFTGNSYKKVLVSTGGASIVNLDDNKPSIYPVDQEKMTKMNGYGYRVHPVTKKRQLHEGVDFAIRNGEDVMSTAEGVVQEVEQNNMRGNYIIIKHDDEYSTSYSHLQSFSVKVGDKVTKGQVIGKSGNTGLSTAPHLHYEVLKNGKRVDPKDYLPK